MVAPNDLVATCGLPRHEAERLLVVAARRSRAELITVDVLDEEELEAFVHLVNRRKQGVPLQYLEGTVQFGPLILKADRRALIPRPETELLWEKVVARLSDDPPSTVVDLCTGSGNLALALKRAFPSSSVWGIDISSEALELAAENSALTGLEVTWSEGDLFEGVDSALEGRVDLVVSNPPYVSLAEFCNVPVDVRDHEPAGALVPGRYGDEVLLQIAAQAKDWLRPGGLVACEIGEAQGSRMLAVFADYAPVVESDLTGRDRFVFGHRRVD